MLFDRFLPTVELLSKLESILSNPSTALSAEFMSYSKSFIALSTVFIASPPGVDSVSRNHFAHPQEAVPHPFTFDHEIITIQSRLQAPLLVSSSLAISTASAMTPSMEV